MQIPNQENAQVAILIWDRRDLRTRNRSSAYRLSELPATGFALLPEKNKRKHAVYKRTVSRQDIRKLRIVVPE